MTNDDRSKRQCNPRVIPSWAMWWLVAFQVPTFGVLSFFVVCFNLEKWRGRAPGAFREGLRRSSADFSQLELSRFSTVKVGGDAGGFSSCKWQKKVTWIHQGILRYAKITRTSSKGVNSGHVLALAAETGPASLDFFSDSLAKGHDWARVQKRCKLRKFRI